MTPAIERKIDEYCKDNPGVFSCEVRERLIRDNICDRLTVPSLGDISHVLKSRIAKENDGKPKDEKKRSSTSSAMTSASSSSEDEKEEKEEERKEKPRRSSSFEGSYSIYNILKSQTNDKEEEKNEENEEDEYVKIKVEGKTCLKSTKYFYVKI